MYCKLNISGFSWTHLSYERAMVHPERIRTMKQWWRKNEYKGRCSIISTTRFINYIEIESCDTGVKYSLLFSVPQMMQSIRFISEIFRSRKSFTEPLSQSERGRNRRMKKPTKSCFTAQSAGRAGEKQISFSTSHLCLVSWHSAVTHSR